MNVAGVTSEVTLLEIPGVMFSEDYASLGTFFLLFVQLVPAFCLVTILLLVNRASLPLSVKKRWQGSFPPQIVGNGGNISRRGVGQFC